MQGRPKARVASRIWSNCGIRSSGGSGYIFRAYFAMPPSSTSEGVPTHATLGFTNMLLRLLRESEADAVAIIFDAGRKSFRNDFYPDYKAHRPEPPEDLIPQFDQIEMADGSGLVHRRPAYPGAGPVGRTRAGERPRGSGRIEGDGRLPELPVDRHRALRLSVEVRIWRSGR